MSKTIKIRDHFEHDGFTFTKIEQSRKTGLFKKECPGDEGQRSIVGYEVFCIGSLKYYPSDEHFGTSAWYYSKLDLAKKHYDRLEKR
jgi:hypothetical protein